MKVKKRANGASSFSASGLLVTVLHGAHRRVEDTPEVVAKFHRELTEDADQPAPSGAAQMARLSSALHADRDPRLQKRLHSTAFSSGGSRDSKDGHEYR